MTNPTETALSQDECQRCNGTGWYIRNVPIGHEDFSKRQRCACRVEADKAARIAALRAQARTEMGKLLDCTLANFDAARLPVGDVSWEGVTYTPDEQRSMLRGAVRLASRFIKEPLGWMLLCGNYGSGKSHIAAAIANALLDTGCMFSYASVPDQFEKLKAGIDTGEYHARLDTLKTIDVLVFDDLGTENLTDWGYEKLFQVVNHRYNNNLTTIFTSNYSLEGLVREDRRYGRIASRIDGMLSKGPITLVASDYRRVIRGMA